MIQAASQQDFDDLRSAEEGSFEFNVDAAQDSSKTRNTWGGEMHRVVGEENAEELVRGLSQEIEANSTLNTLKGYPALAEFLSSDERWSIYRRFKYLQSRLILEKQEELRLLDEELRDMDLEVAQDEPHNAEAASKLNTRHRRNPEEAHSRSEYFEKAERLYKEYAALLGASRQMMALEKPAFHERKSVRHFISATKPVVQREAAWLEDPADLVTLRGVRPHATFNALLEAILTRAKHYLNPPRTIETWLAANVTAEKISNRVISLFLIVSVPTIFFAPIYILTVVAHNIGKGIAVLVVFALLFIFVLAIGTTAKSHEIWNSAAA